MKTILEFLFQSNGISTAYTQDDGKSEAVFYTPQFAPYIHSRAQYFAQSNFHFYPQQ